jgi:hypothetical protein
MCKERVSQEQEGRRKGIELLYYGVYEMRKRRRERERTDWEEEEFVSQSGQLGRLDGWMVGRKKQKLHLRRYLLALSITPPRRPLVGPHWPELRLLVLGGAGADLGYRRLAAGGWRQKKRPHMQHAGYGKREGRVGDDGPCDGTDGMWPWPWWMNE